MFISVSKETHHEGTRILEGHFLSPVNEHCPGIMPKEVEIARYTCEIKKKQQVNYMRQKPDHG